jgi:hypothetical protein
VCICRSNFFPAYEGSTGNAGCPLQKFSPVHFVPLTPYDFLFEFRNR